MTDPKEQQVLACHECSAEMEGCAFCEREDCPEAICYRCLRSALGQSLPQPHVHGG